MLQTKCVGWYRISLDFLALVDFLYVVDSQTIDEIDDLMT